MNVFQAGAFELLHHNERMAAVVLDVVNGADAGMVQLRSGARFAHEAVQGLAVLGHFFGDELQGNMARQARVFGLIHHAHATTAQFSENAIVGDCLADHSEGLKAIGR